MRAVGISPRQLFTMISLEYLLIAGHRPRHRDDRGAAHLARRCSSFLNVTDDGQQVVPDFALVTRWDTVGIAFCAVGVAFLVGVLALAGLLPAPAGQPRHPPDALRAAQVTSTAAATSGCSPRLTITVAPGFSDVASSLSPGASALGLGAQAQRGLAPCCVSSVSARRADFDDAPAEHGAVVTAGQLAEAGEAGLGSWRRSRRGRPRRPARRYVEHVVRRLLPACSAAAREERGDRDRERCADPGDELAARGAASWRLQHRVSDDHQPDEREHGIRMRYGAAVDPVAGLRAAQR